VRYLIRHHTRLAFDKAPISEHQVLLRLYPREDSLQKVLRADIRLDPEAELSSWIDPFGNRCHSASILPMHDHLSVSLEAEVECLLVNPFDYLAIPPQREARWIAETLRAKPRLLDYVLHHSASTPSLLEVDSDLELPRCLEGKPLLQSVQEAMAWIQDHFEYDPTATEVHEDLEEVIALRAGVCQDFAHLLIGIVRSWGLPARYVAGYQHPDLAEEDQPPAPHAWAEVLVPGAGWLGFDPSSQLVVNDHYIAAAVGRNSWDAAPLHGSYKGNGDGEPPVVEVEVIPLDEPDEKPAEKETGTPEYDGSDESRPQEQEATSAQSQSQSQSRT
jgi:transglutaminase-like putative cysteine protease